MVRLEGLAEAKAPFAGAGGDDAGEARQPGRAAGNLAPAREAVGEAKVAHAGVGLRLAAGAPRLRVGRAFAHEDAALPLAFQRVADVDRHAADLEDGGEVGLGQF